MASLKDIAEAAGVSIRTVNRVLTGQGYAGPDTRRRVQAEARRLGYRPNRHARSLRTRRSFEVAVVAWSVDELHMAKIVALEQTLRRRDFSVNVLFVDRSAGVAGRDALAAELVARKPAGVAVFPLPGGGTADWIARLSEADLPCMAFDAPAPSDSVRIDRSRGIAEAVHHLARTGRHRIAYLGQSRDANRLEGYRRALAELGRTEMLLEMADHSPAEARRIGRELAGLPVETRPDAVQAYSDVVAMGLLAGLHDAGLAVPDDVAVVGFDDRPAAALAWPALTTVAQPNEAVGQAVGELLLAKIDAADPPEQGWSRALPTRLVVREST